MFKGDSMENMKELIDKILPQPEVSATGVVKTSDGKIKGSVSQPQIKKEA